MNEPAPVQVIDISASSVLETGGDPRPTSILNVTASISAASLRQALRQFDRGRLIIVVTHKGRRGPAEPAASRAWAEQQREGLSSPEGGLVLVQSLRRQADAQGIDVALVTRDGKLRQQAEEAGIPVFGSLAGAEENEWRLTPSRMDYRPPSPMRDRHESVSEKRRGLLAARFRRVRLAQGDRKPIPALLETLLLLGFLVLCIATVASVLAFLVPAATVRLIPAQEPLAEKVTITARSDVEAADYADKIIPARRIGQKVEVEGTIQSTGSEAAPDQPAQGAVVFTNRRPEPQDIPAGTLVATSTGSNVRFETTAPAFLPGAVGAQVTVPLQGVAAGPQRKASAFPVSTIAVSRGCTAKVGKPWGN